MLSSLNNMPMASLRKTPLASYVDLWRSDRPFLGRSWTEIKQENSDGAAGRTQDHHHRGRIGYRARHRPAAGILAETGIADTTAEVFSRTVAVNLTGTFLVIQAAAPLIQKAGKGTIVNIASGLGLMPTGPGSIAYVASKGGVVALTKSVAMELAPNIRVNSVCPGAVETAMTAGHIRTAAGDPNPAITARYALGRHAQPEELAAAILFLTSDESSIMTGIALPVDGGRTFH
jgi:hypothetical protein